MATLFDTMFTEAIPAAVREPLLRDAMALFKDHWTAADGVEELVFAHDGIDIMGRTTAGWRANNNRAHASATLAAELQVKVAALEAKLAKPTPKDSASKISNLAENQPQKLHTAAP